MALQVEQGVFAANTSTGDQTVTLADSGLTPKLVMLWGTFRTSAGVEFADGNFTFGVGTRDGGSTQQVSMASFNDNGAGTSATVHALDNDNVFEIITSDAAEATGVDGKATLVSFGAGQFVINWSNAPASAIKIHYQVWGGSDITAARVTKPVTSTSAATQDVTVAASWGQPDLIIHATHSFTSTYGQNDSRVSLGFASKAGEQAVMIHDYEDASANMSLATWYSASRCLLFFGSGTGKDAECSISASGSWPTDGYQLTYNDQASFGFHFISLAVKGTFISKIGASEMLTAGANQDLDLGSGTPKGLLLMANNSTLADNTVFTTAGTLGGFYIGGSDGTHEGGAGTVDLSGNTSSRASRYHSETKAIQRYLPQTTVATLDAEADASITGTNFRLAYNDLAAAAADFIWLIVGEAASEQHVDLTPATEADAAQALNVDTLVSLTAATETDTAQALTVFVPGVAITPATETDSAVALSYYTVASLTSATETDAAQTLDLETQVDLTPATETTTAAGLVELIASVTARLRTLMGMGT